MLFNSYVFIFLFFPVTLLLYFGLNSAGKFKAALGILTGASLIFYAYFNVWYLGILVGSILVNWCFSRLLINKKRKSVLTVGIITNIAVIFVFKYSDFFIGNVNALFGASIPLLNILMPLGISFFTFQQISYLADSYRGETKDYSILEYALFVSFFPQLIAGPIVLHQEMIPSFRNPDLKKFNSENFAEGLHMFAIGLAKKVLLADTLAKGVDWGYANIDALGGFNMFLVVIMYSFQLYFDFSGYCDMACAIATCFNFKLPVNFMSPYKAASIGEFWKRWHITLTRFLTRYIYIPLGGSRKGKVRTLINIVIVFLISGLWHGADWTFVLWGALHAIAMVLYRLFGKVWDKVAKFVRVAITYLFVTLAWIPFRATSIAEMKQVFAVLFSKWDFSLQQEFCKAFDVLEFTYIEEHLQWLGTFVSKVPSLHVWIILTVSCGITFLTKNVHEKRYTPGVVNAVSTAILLVWSVVSFAGVSTFLYFNF